MRYAILSDIHANLPALQAVLDDLSDQSVTALIYLGDAVGYYADSAAVIALLSDLVMSGYGKRDGREEHGLLWVPGNHEWGLLERTEEHFFSPAARIALQQTRTDLTADELELLAHLPQRIELDLEDNLSLTICHATPGDPVGLTGYIENSEDARDAAQHLTTPLCLVGHTHYPRICAEEAASVAGQARWEVIDVFEAMLPGGQYPLGDQRLILNPGSVGQPRDGDPRAAYAILDTGAKTFSVRRIPYDIADTQARLRAWLPNAPAALLDGQGGLAGRLELGI